MKQINYTDKIQNGGITPNGIFSANDANEIKNVVNTNAQEVAEKYVSKDDYVLGISGTVTTTQTLPQLNALADGIYEAQTAGLYANGLTAKVGFYTRFQKTGTVWVISSETEMPSVIPIEDWDSSLVYNNSNLVFKSGIVWQLLDGAVANNLEIPGISPYWISKSGIKTLSKTALSLAGVTWGFYMSGTNTPVANIGSGYTTKIPVTPSTVYKFEGYTYPIGGCFYDASGAPLGAITMPNGASSTEFTTLSNAVSVILNIKIGVNYEFGLPSDFGKFFIPNLESPTETTDAINLLNVNVTKNTQDISSLNLNKASKSEVSKKVDKNFEISSTFDNSSFVNATFPFWPRTSVEASWKFIQFNLKAKQKTEIGYIDIAGAYINDSDLHIGTGNVCVRIYKGVTFTANKSNFTNATLITKSVTSIDNYFNNSMKGVDRADLLTRLQNGERGYTRFEFETLSLEKDEVFQVYFGVDDDSIYSNNPNMATPSCRISIVGSGNTTLGSSLLSANSPSTFLSSSAEAQFVNTTSYPGLRLPTLNEVTLFDDFNFNYSRDIYTFVGAFNKVLDELFAVRPRARVAMIGHNTLAGRTTTGQGGEHFKKLVKVQQQLANYWGCYYLPLWTKLNWVNNQGVNTFKAYCPDEIHPYSDTVKVSTAIGQMAEADFIIHNHVKEFLKPIFGDDWAGKKVATYGTSIPYGGKYSILATQELGGVGFNYCSSGSYIRRGNTSGVNQNNSFTNIDQTVYRNYKTDMLDLIGTANEPDLFLFDFGINDFNLDQSDF